MIQCTNLHFCELMWCCTIREQFFLYGDNSEKADDAADLLLIFPIETLHVSKTGNVHLSNIHSYPGVPALHRNVWLSRKFQDLS